MRTTLFFLPPCARFRFHILSDQYVRIQIYFAPIARPAPPQRACTRFPTQLSDTINISPYLLVQLFFFFGSSFLWFFFPHCDDREPQRDGVRCAYSKTADAQLIRALRMSYSQRDSGSKKYSWFLDKYYGIMPLIFDKFYQAVGHVSFTFSFDLSSTLEKSGPKTKTW